jgi:hypothetical protein
MRLSSCLSATGMLERPPLDRAHDGMELTVRSSLTRFGRIFGKEAVTFESHDACNDDRLICRKSVADALERCTPLPITDGCGDAIGRDRRPSGSLTHEGKGAPPLQRFSTQFDDARTTPVTANRA